MLSRDYRDIVGGLVLTVFGLWVAWYANEYYDLGRFRRMGPGMFPVLLGLVLAAFGVMIALPAFFRSGRRPDIRVWTPIFVTAGVAGFALTIKPFGLIPAIIAVTVISSLAELRVRPVSLALLCAALSLISFLIFRVALGLPMPMFRWPF